MQEFNNHNSVFLLPFDIQNEKTGNNNTNDKYLIKNNSNLYNELETAKGFISYFFGDLIDTLILKDCEQDTIKRQTANTIKEENLFIF